MIISDFKWNIAGHRKIAHFLQKSIVNKRIAHAYLFVGPESVGKTRMAEYFSASLLCQGEGKIPCQKCVYCQQFFKKIYPDLYLIEKKEGKKNVSIDQIRDLRGKLSKRSFLNSYKIAIIKEAETLNREGWNALLKTLEEPSENTIIILITANLKNLPETIISRSQLIKFLTVNKQEIYNYFLQEYNLPVKKAEILSSLCHGRPGLGIKFIEDKKLLEIYEDKASSLFEIINTNQLSDKFGQLDSLVKSKLTFLEARESWQNLLSIWVLLLRDCLLFKTANHKFIINNFAQKELEVLAKSYSLEKIKSLLQNTIKTKNYLYQNINPRLAIENLILNF